MLIKITRILAVLLVIFVVAVSLPGYYWKITEKYVPPPRVLYSPIIHDFTFVRNTDDGVAYMDNQGNELDRDHYEELSPLMYWRQMAKAGKMPDSINGVKIDLHEVGRNQNYLRVKPAAIIQPMITLYPLLEAQSDRARLEFPEEYFRIDNRFEFIHCKDNEVEEEQSELFTGALKDAGFVFPATYIAGNPSTRKPFDEGYFVVDSDNKLYHIKKMKGKPYVAEVPKPDDMKIVYIQVYENELREFYALMVTENSELYFISYDNYNLIKLPSEGYKYDRDAVRVSTNLFYRTVEVNKEHSLDVYVTDRNYKQIAEYHEEWKGNHELAAGKIASVLFPFTISLENENSSYIDFNIDFSNMSAFLGIGIFLILTFLLIRRRRRINNTKSYYIADIITVLLTGIYGFIAVLLVRDEL